MPYKLVPEQIDELISQPETGMGYQYVEATMSDDSFLKGLVLNSEVFIPENRIEKITGRNSLSYSAILKEAEQPGYISKLRIIKKESLQIGEIKLFTKPKHGPASEAAISSIEKNQVFKRFSHYEKDHRITSNGSLLPGSYATTEVDARNVKTGVEAISRYALPSDEPAIYVFTILPPEKTPIRIGIVQPANGKPGGGIEVIFEKGSPEKTVVGPEIIPER